MAQTAPFKYRAFLSYSHRDRTWGSWLHATIEGYRVDKDLVGRPTPFGPVPKTLRPIFRDREDFAAGHSLSEQTLAALCRSKFLLVLCSPNAAKSPYVNEEILRFKAMGRSDYVIPVIVDGEPGDPESECFPPALLFKVSPDGILTDQTEEPIAADARPAGDGKYIATQKVVAGLLGLGLDEIVRRAELARKRRNRIWAGLAGVFLFLALVATGSAIYAYQQLTKSEQRLDQAIEIAYGFVSESTSMSDQFGVPADVTISLLERAEAALNWLLKEGADTPKLRHRKALMLLSFSSSRLTLGQHAKAMSHADEARTLLQELVASQPDNIAWQSDLAISHHKIADVFFYKGMQEDALKHYNASVAGLIRSVNISNSEDAALRPRLRSLVSSYNRAGEIFAARGKIDEARGNYSAGLKIMEVLVVAHPEKVEWQHYLAWSHNYLSEMLRAKASWDEALKHARAAIAIIEPIARIDRGNSRFLRDLAVAHRYYLGDLLWESGSRPEAMEHYQIALAIMERLTATDPKNVLWQKELSWAYTRMGRASQVSGDLQQALIYRQKALAIIKRLSANDPQNVALLRDLAWGYNNLGSEHFLLRAVEEALENYRMAVTLFERVAATDPKSVRWQRDLILGYCALGEALSVQGAHEEALQKYKRMVETIEGLLAAFPNDVRWETDLLTTPLSRLAPLVAGVRQVASERALSDALTRFLSKAEGRLAELQTQ